MELTINQVIEEGYCIGCGVCPFADSSIRIERDSNGKNQAVLGKSPSKSATAICPFASSKRNEDVLGEKYYGSQDGVKYTKELGYYLATYVGYVQSGDFRKNGSSGGTANWILSKLFEENLIDGVIHVKDSDEKNNMYSYQVSESAEELASASKSKYYPVELSKVLEQIRKSKKRYALVGIPCFIKAIRLLQQDFPEMNEKIVYTIGLVCGHLKSDFFAKSEAWESGIKPEELERVDFRVELPGKAASDYGIEVTGTVDGVNKTVVAPTRNLSTTNWGYGFFKYQACDYCDDVLAEVADLTVGDAWLPGYVEDAKGTNVIVVRNQKLLDIFNKHKIELKLFNSSAEEITESQAGGFRHRREGLMYRLWMKQQNGELYPTKRIVPSNNIPEKRKKIYEARIKLVEESFKAYHAAEKTNDFDDFKTYMRPIVKQYDTISIPFNRRLKKKVNKMVPNDIKKLLKRLRS